MSVSDIVNSIGFDNLTYVGEFDTASAAIPITQETRCHCEENLCGNYGNNWACPPNVPPVTSCGIILSSYPRMTMVRTTYPRTDIFDLDEIRKSMRLHNGFARKLRDRLNAEGLRFKLLSAGGCGYCERCSAPHSPCRFPDERMFSIESYGIDLTSFLMKVGVSYRCGNEEQSFFLMVFHD